MRNVAAQSAITAQNHATTQVSQRGGGVTPSVHPNTNVQGKNSQGSKTICCFKCGGLGH